MSDDLRIDCCLSSVSTGRLSVGVLLTVFSQQATTWAELLFGRRWTPFEVPPSNTSPIV